MARRSGPLRRYAGHIFAVMSAVAAPAALSGAQDECEVQWIPEEMPPLNDVVDSVAFMEELASIPAPPDDPTILLTLRFVRGLIDHRVDIIGTEAPLQTAATVRGMAESHMPAAEAEEPWGVRLRVLLGSETRITLEESGYCPPSPVQPIPRGLPVTEMINPGEMDDLLRAGLVRVRVTVNEHGRVIAAELIIRSASQMQNRDVYEQAWTREFEPATLDGLTVPSTYEYAVRWRIGRD